MRKTLALALSLLLLSGCSEVTVEQPESASPSVSENVDVSEHPAESEQPESTTFQIYAAELTHNGSVQTIELDASSDELYVLYIFDADGKELWRTGGGWTHIGWTAVYLTYVDDLQFLMVYEPSIYQGCCYYSFRVFSLDSDGNEVLFDEDYVEFGLNLPESNVDFRTEHIEPVKAFFEHLNIYLADSEVLLISDQTILSHLSKEQQSRRRSEDDPTIYATQDDPILNAIDYFYISADLTLNEQLELFVQDYIDKYGYMDDTVTDFEVTG